MRRPLLLSCDAVCKTHGTRTLFESLSFGLFKGDRAGLVGPNGSGKSTLLRILAGLEAPDRGARSARGSIRIGYVPQDPVFPSGATVEAEIAGALAALDESDRPGRIAQALGRAGLPDAAAAVDTLSGGGKKRLAIARELAARPDVLLMDEPTNHLDVDGILWLEGVLTEEAGAFLVVSHDRYFLEHVVSRVLELSPVYPAGLFETEGTYSEFLARRDEYLRGQAAYEESLANSVRREIEWLRRGAKARSTKAKGRIKEAGRLIEELDDARARSRGGVVGIDLAGSGRRTRELLVARGLAKAAGGRTLFRDLDLTITPGTRVGLIGPNGSGKTTLLALLAGTLAPDAGEISRADGLRLARFQQDRSGLALDQPLRQALAPDGNTLVVRGASLHVAAWAKRFRFRPEQLEVPVGHLSGGEQARILIARLMREPVDLLILDEPTNDLDISTLEVLEDSLAEYAGGLVLVTHDRFMLERVATVILALDGAGGAETFASYAQWEAARHAPPPAEARGGPVSREPTRAAPRTKRLGYLEQREWDAMEETIMAAEEAVTAARNALEDPSIASDAAALQARAAALETAHGEVVRLYARWAELEAKLGP
ncbi:MAG: ABC-F family ATP-binding cassette domain-containing protein [Candidatus Rokuibacteriota bacterium]